MKKHRRLLPLLLALLLALPLSLPITASDGDEPITVTLVNEYYVFLATADLPEDFVTYSMVAMFGSLRRFTYEPTRYVYDLVDYQNNEFSIMVVNYPRSAPLPESVRLSENEIKDGDLRFLIDEKNGIVVLGEVYYVYTQGRLTEISWPYADHRLILTGTAIPLYEFDRERAGGLGDLLDRSQAPEKQEWLVRATETSRDDSLPLMRTDYESYRTLADSKLIPEDFIRAEALSDFGDFSAFLCHSYHSGGFFNSYSYLFLDEVGYLTEFSVGVSYGGFFEYIEQPQTAYENDMRLLSAPESGGVRINDIVYLYEKGKLQYMYWLFGDDILTVTAENGLSTYERTDTLLSRLLHADTAGDAVAEINERIANYTPDTPIDPILFAAIGLLLLTLVAAATLLLIRTHRIKAARTVTEEPTAPPESAPAPESDPAPDPVPLREKPAPDPTADFPEHTYYADQNPEDWAPPRR